MIRQHPERPERIFSLAAITIPSSIFESLEMRPQAATKMVADIRAQPTANGRIEFVACFISMELF